MAASSLSSIHPIRRRNARPVLSAEKPPPTATVESGARCLLSGSTPPDEPVRGRPRPPELPRAKASSRRTSRRRAVASGDGRARGGTALRAPPRRAGRRSDADGLGRVGAADRPHRSHAALEGSGASRRAHGSRRDRVRAAVRRPLPPPPDGAGLPARAVLGRLQLPARDDGRRGAHARRLRQPRTDRARVAAPYEPRAGARLDFGPMDDGAHGRLRRGTDGDDREKDARRLAALRHEVVHVGDDLRDGAHARAPRKETRRGEAGSLSSTSRRATNPALRTGSRSCA